jgi:hypothetical protein
MKILDKLSTYAALIGTVTAIGGGFYAWGEFNNRLSVLEGEPPVNLQPLHSKDKELNAKIDEALLYAIGITWGMFTERLDAVEQKADTIAEIKSDIAVIKEKIMWMEKYLITNGK